MVSVVWFLFHLYDLLLIMIGPAMIVFLIFLYLMWKCPNARAVIKAWLLKRVLVPLANDAGLVEFRIVKPLAEGQFQGKKREVYVTPRISNPIVTKRFVLKGEGIPVFFGYSGKTVLTNPEVLAAIEVVESLDKDKLPESIKEWAKTQKVKVGRKEIPLFALDSRKLKFYFKEHYDESQYDVLLQKYFQMGFDEGRAGRGYGRLAISIVGIVMAMLLAVIVLRGLGVI